MRIIKTILFEMVVRTLFLKILVLIYCIAFHPWFYSKIHCLTCFFFSIVAYKISQFKWRCGLLRQFTRLYSLYYVPLHYLFRFVICCDINVNYFELNCQYSSVIQRQVKYFLFETKNRIVLQMNGIFIFNTRGLFLK